MAKIPLPERGQPLDVTYIYQLADAFNDLSDSFSSSVYNYTSVDTISAGTQNVPTSQSRIIGKIVSVADNSTVNAGNEKSFSVSFDTGFKYSPVVTASPVNIGGTQAGQNITVVITSITTSGVTGVVRFNASGNLSVSVHVIAIGVPN
jgi:hypothetical protein